jgi:Tol biopolymer transport system component
MVGHDPGRAVQRYPGFRYKIAEWEKQGLGPSNFVPFSGGGMMRSRLCILWVMIGVLGGLIGCPRPGSPPPGRPGTAGFRVLAPLAGEEPYFETLWELTDVGENAEAYFSWDDTRLVFQSTRPPYACDQIFILDLRTGRLQRVSPGRGRTTCGYFLPGDAEVLFSSTHHVSPECPPRPDLRRGYAWALYDYDIYIAHPDGSGLRPLFQAPGYQAEATVARDGRIVFTSDHEGDLELYVMEADHRTVRRVTHVPGYDGGAFFSPDGQWIVFRGHHPEEGPERDEYFSLLRDRLVRPFRMEIFVVRPDGTGLRQVTHNGGANFAPYFTPNGRFVIYASNMHEPRGRDFDLYVSDLDGRGTVRVTYFRGFDGFPMFSHDCQFLVFASNRTERSPGQTNLFLGRLTAWARQQWCP